MFYLVGSHPICKSGVSCAGVYLCLYLAHLVTSNLDHTANSFGLYAYNVDFNH